MLRSLLLAAVVLLAPAALAQAPDAVVDDFVSTTRLDDQVSALAGQFLPMLQMQAQQMPAPVREPYVSTFTSAFSDARLASLTRAYLAEQADGDQLAAATAWYQEATVSPMMDRMMAANEDPNAQIAVQMYAQTGQLGRHTVSEEEEALAGRYLDASNSVDAGLDLYTSIIAASNALNARLVGVEMPTDRAAIRQMLAAQAPMIEGGMRGSVLYAFRGADPEAVEAFIARYEDPAADYSTRMSTAAMAYAIETALLEATDTFMAEVERLDAEGELDLDAWRAEMQAQVQAQMEAQEQMHHHEEDGHDH